MKNKIFSFLIFGTLFLGFLSCDKYDPTDLIVDASYFGMEGFGNNEDRIIGETLILPDGVTITGNIEGYDPNNQAKKINKSNFDKKNFDFFENYEKIESKTFYNVDTILGSGEYVKVILQFYNSNSIETQVNIPAATVFESTSTTYQNGLLVKEVNFSIPANSSYNVVLCLYCCNFSRHASDASANFNFPVIVSNRKIIDFCRYFITKKINYEEKPENYSSQVTKIQSLLWELTQIGILPTDKDLDWIEKLPESF